MGADTILAIFDVIGKVKSAIAAIADLVKNGDDFLNGITDWDRMRVFLMRGMVSHGEVLQIAAGILDAVAQLDRRIFLERIADKLGDSDQAVLALDTWKRTDDVNQKSFALNDSAGALSDVLRYANNSVYPNESLVYPLIQILVPRLVILKEADPDFVRSTISRQPIEDCIILLRSTADSMEVAIQQANVIHEDNQRGTGVSTRPPEEGGGRQTVQFLRLSVHYRNIDGSVIFDRHGYFEPEDGDFDAIIAQARADAAAARQRGVAHDLERAQITLLRETADVAERSLRVAEARWVTSKFLKRQPTDMEIAYFVARRDRASFEEVALTFEAYMELNKESLGTLATEVSGRQIGWEGEESLWNVAQAFGEKAVLRMLLADGIPSDEPDDTAMHARALATAGGES